MPPLKTIIVGATLIAGASCVFASPTSFTHVDLASPSGTQLRVEALDPHILRLWQVKPGAKFERPVSLAMETAPTTRVPLRVSDDAGPVLIQSGALSLQIDRATLAFEISPPPKNGPLLPPTTISFAQNGPGWSLARRLGAGERLLALGQDNHNNGRLDRRGVIRELWAGQQINSGNVTAEYPVPLLICLGDDGRAFGLFFDNVHKLRFDLGATNKNELRLDAAGGDADLYFIDGPRIADVIERYTRLTGRPALPPLWALGYWQSKCTYYDWKALDGAYNQLDSRGFPVDVMVIDFDWPEFMTNYRWAKRWYPEGRTPADKIKDYRQKGVRIVNSQSGPAVKEDSPTFATGWAAGIFATDGKGNPVECCHYSGKLLDFTHPKNNDWLWPQLRKINEDGVAGWWLDLTEPEGEPPQTHYYGGARPAEIHNQYSLLCTRSFEGVQLSVHPDQRPFILNRCAPAGAQRYHQAVWTGDVYSDYPTYRAHPPEMLNSGLSGLIYWTSDSGGFMEGYYKKDQMGAHARLYERWMQLSVFSPVTRAHKAGGVAEPYQFGPAVEQSCLHYLKLRYRLLPYIYTHAWEASRNGLPIVRPLALEFQDDPRSVATPGDQYLFGRNLLVAPALFEGQTNRKVYFPPGKWTDWDNGYEFIGGRDYVVAAPQNRIPLFVRAGAIIPLAPEMKNTGEKPWDPLTLEIYPSGKSSFTLYRDDGVSFGYRLDEFTTTVFTCEETPKSVRLSIAESNKRFTPARYEARFHLASTPTKVTDAAGTELSHIWNAETRLLTLTLASGTGTTHGIFVALDGVPLPPRPAPALVLEVIDPKTESAGSAGKPVPHFYPAPTLPNRIKAINYNKGGEGVAFHSIRPLPQKPNYRADDFSIVEGNDAGGSFVLGGLRPSEWVRYLIDCGNGGWYDLTVRVASSTSSGRFRLLALDQTLATVNVPATGGDDAWQDVRIPGVYINPGELDLMLFVDAPGFRLNTLEFTRAENPPRVYPATQALRGAFTEVLADGGSAGKGAVKNLGRKGSQLTWGVVAPATGTYTLRLHYHNDTGLTLPYQLLIGEAAPQPFTLAPTNGWTTSDLKVNLTAGANRLTIAGQVEKYDCVTLENIELVAP
jgi:alpha-glucosidase